MTGDDALNHWTPEQLARHQRLVADGRPVRYYGRRKRMNLWLSVATFLRFGRWRRWEQTFEPVFPWQEGYEEAPYESTTIFNKHTFKQVIPEARVEQIRAKYKGRWEF